MALLVDRLRANRRAWERITATTLADREVESEMVALIRGGYVPVYEITNVARYVYDAHTKVTGEASDLGYFPNVAPPHVAYWMEWVLPEGLGRHVGAAPRRVAMLFWQQQPRAEGIWAVSAAAFGMWTDKRPSPLCSWDLRFVEHGLPVIEGLHRYAGLADLFESASRQTEMPTRLSEAEFLAKYGLPRSITAIKAKLAELEHEQGKVQAIVDATTEALEEQLTVWVRTAVLYVSLMAHSLLACRNVVLEEHAPPAKLSRRHERDHGVGLVKFKTLRVMPMGGGGARSGASGQLSPSLHIVRGHFKTYTADRPLFGKYTGTYWWTPGLRGDASRGVVVKDYEMGPQP